VCVVGGMNIILLIFLKNRKQDALDVTMITNGEPVSPSPLSSSEHPACQEEVTALDLVVPAGKKVGAPAVVVGP
jgi:hypothetical protein